MSMYNMAKIWKLIKENERRINELEIIQKKDRSNIKQNIKTIRGKLKK